VPDIVNDGTWTPGGLAKGVVSQRRHTLLTAFDQSCLHIDT
jgi:hypothetical protein